ncbi:MAG: hypothetical protein A2511_07810 [Deltaproteobacteria bacterium RIFOXYD12_FULL_50_9]|nr:MAG: hypothetical protein A2511_07810 [Deltaproteobacteria bacterium RIFOXYD12_FULL_50_9]
MAIISIQYIFTSANGSQVVFDLRLDSCTLDLLNDIPSELPAWTKLEFHQCPHCPLLKAETPHCPLSVQLINIVKGFQHLSSYDPIHVEVVTLERKVSLETTAQRAIGSIMGLIIATCGCPHTTFFKPMARFHLPLASEDETIYRAAANYLLAQYFLSNQGQKPDFELKGLKKIYENMQIINNTIAKRLRAATETDSSLNAIILLDLYAKAMPYVIKEALEEIRQLFVPFLVQGQTIGVSESSS